MRHLEYLPTSFRNTFAGPVPGEYISQWTDCPFPVDELPEYNAPSPPPLFEGQLIAQYNRNRFGHLLSHQEAIAVRDETGLRWHLLRTEAHSAKHWGEIILFPRA
jgi:hypothetical protein